MKPNEKIKVGDMCLNSKTMSISEVLYKIGDYFLVQDYEGVISYISKRFVTKVDSIYKPFKCNGLIITRADVEGLPCPLNTSKVRDSAVQIIANIMYYSFTKCYGFTESQVKQYLQSENESDNEYDRFWDIFWEDIEKLFIDYGATYYEDEK